MKVMSIFGTRPEMIKMWSTLKKLDELNFEHVMVHTGPELHARAQGFLLPRSGAAQARLPAQHRHFELRARGRRRDPQVRRAVREGQAGRAADPRRYVQRPLGDAGRASRHQDLPHGSGPARLGQAHAGAAQPHPDRPHEQHPAAVQPLPPREPAPREHPSRRRSSSPATRLSRRCGHSCRRSRQRRAQAAEADAEGLHPGDRASQRERRQPGLPGAALRGARRDGAPVRAARSSTRCTRAPRASSKDIEIPKGVESWRRSASTISTSCSRIPSACCRIRARRRKRRCSTRCRASACA